MKKIFLSILFASLFASFTVFSVPPKGDPKTTGRVIIEDIPNEDETPLNSMGDGYQGTTNTTTTETDSERNSRKRNHQERNESSSQDQHDQSDQQEPSKKPRHEEEFPFVEERMEEESDNERDDGSFVSDQESQTKIIKERIIAFLSSSHPKLKEKYEQNPDGYCFSTEEAIRFEVGHLPEIDLSKLSLSEKATPIIIVYDDGNIEFARIKDIPLIFNKGICKCSLENKFFYKNYIALEAYKKMLNSKNIIKKGKKELEKLRERLRIYKKYKFGVEAIERVREEITKQIEKNKKNEKSEKRIISSMRKSLTSSEKEIIKKEITNIETGKFCLNIGVSYDTVFAPDTTVSKIGGYVLIAPRFYDDYELERLKCGEKEFEEDILLIGVDLSGPVKSRGLNVETIYSRRDLTELNLKSAILIGANLSYTDLTGSNLNYINLTCADLPNALLGPYTDLRFAILENTNFNFATLEDVIVTSARICNGTSFRKAILNNLNFSSYDEFNIDNRFDTKYKLKDLDFFRAQLNRISFTDCLLERIDMRQVKADMIFFNNTTMNDVDFSSKAELRNFLLFNTNVFGKNINFEDSLIENGIFLGKTEMITNADEKIKKKKEEGSRSLLSDSNFRFTTILNTLFMSFTFKDCIGLEQTRQLTNTTFENFELELPSGSQSGVSSNGLLLWLTNKMEKNDEIINQMRACSAKVNSYISDDFTSIWNEYSNGWVGRVGMRLGTIALDSLVSYGMGAIVNGMGAIVNGTVSKAFGDKKAIEEEKSDKEKKMDDSTKLIATDNTNNVCAGEAKK